MGELERDKLHLQRTKEAELVAQTEKPLTDTELEVVDAEIPTLVGKAAGVRKRPPALGHCSKRSGELAPHKQPGAHPCVDH